MDKSRGHGDTESFASTVEGVSDQGDGDLLYHSRGQRQIELLLSFSKQAKPSFGHLTSKLVLVVVQMHLAQNSMAEYGLRVIREAILARTR